jgi:hypothetical protein
LAEKLKQCEVFGKVSDELLDYAKKNREGTFCWEEVNLEKAVIG